MTPQESLALSATHVDDAIEYLTFDRPDWSLEELWHGVARLVDLHAGRSGPRDQPVKGALPPAGSLARAASDPRVPPPVVELVARIESVRAQHDPGRCAAPSTEETPFATLEALCFDASELLGHCAARRGVLDPGAVYGALAGPNEPIDASRLRAAERRAALVRRRTVLKMLGAGALASLAGCNRPTAAPTAENERAEAASSPREIESQSGGTPSIAPASVRAVTALDAMQWPTSDPFLFCAYHLDAYPAGNPELGPVTSLQGRALGRDFDPNRDWRMYHGQVVPGFPRHPHRGFETVTVVRTGRLDHADSLGATARYGGGDVQWLTAGGGIQHAEMFPLLHSDSDNPLELFQIWLNLPARDKMVDPHFTMLWSEEIPRVIARDASDRVTELTIAAGAWQDHRPPSPPPSSWASRPESDLAIWTLRMEAGARFELPAVAEGTERSLYLHRGAGAVVGDRDVRNMHRAELDGHGPIAVEAGAAEIEILLVQARPIGEPIARRGPFVMSTQAEIRQAYADYRSTGFGGWPWPDDAPVHDRGRGRFALHPDGRLDEPT